MSSWTGVRLSVTEWDEGQGNRTDTQEGILREPGVDNRSTKKTRRVYVWGGLNDVPEGSQWTHSALSPMVKALCRWDSSMAVR